MRTVVVNNRGGNVIGQMPPVGHIDSDKRIPMLGEVIVFYPGVNMPDAKKLAKLRENASFDKLFTTKIEPSAAPEQEPNKVGRFILEIDKTVGNKGEVPDAAPIAKLPEAQCASIIAETFMADLLRDWLKEEGRPEVRRMLYEQLEKVGPSKSTASSVPA